MKIEMEQRSSEWFEFRKNKIGASEIGTIMGLNPYETPLQWWEFRKGLRAEKTISPAMQYGIDNEDKARKWIADRCMITYEAAVYQSDENEFMMSSLDGISSIGTILEIKCSKKCLEDCRKNKIDQMYLAQMQMQMYCSGAHECKFLAWYEGEGCYIDIQRDEIYIKNIIEKATESKRRLEENDPYPSDFLEVDIGIEDYIKVFSYLDLQKRKKEMEQEEKQLRKDLADLTDDLDTILNYEGSPVLKMTRVLPKARVDYEALCAANGITDEMIHKFRKVSQDIGYWRMEKA